jgi:predicted component of type VI protein secretion system
MSMLNVSFSMISIRVISCNGKVRGTLQACRFPASGGTIGRAPSNDLVLADPECLVSRTHAHVKYGEGQWRLENFGTNSIHVNEEKVPHGCAKTIAEGDNLRIGPYVLKVEKPAPVDQELENDRLVVPEDPFTEPGDHHDAHGAVESTAPLDFDVSTVIPTEPAEVYACAKTAPAFGASDQENALLAALTRGLGLEELLGSPGLTPELMERLGELLREATQGTVDLLAACARIQREVRAKQTVFSLTGNNPLKLSGGDAGVALAHVLGPQTRGWLSPGQAMRDAFADLRSHELALVAGVRASLAGLLERLDPQAFEARLAQSKVETLLPGGRRARAWELYAEFYRGIARELVENPNALFGVDFVRAYEAQVARASTQEPSGASQSARPSAGDQDAAPPGHWLLQS